jgi:hypothetical protein
MKDTKKQRPQFTRHWIWFLLQISCWQFIISQPLFFITLANPGKFQQQTHTHARGISTVKVQPEVYNETTEGLPASTVCPSVNKNKKFSFVEEIFIICSIQCNIHKTSNPALFSAVTEKLNLNRWCNQATLRHLWNPKIHHRDQQNPPGVSTISQMHPTHNICSTYHCRQFIPHCDIKHKYLK